jgi:hypothetical protein
MRGTGFGQSIPAVGKEIKGIITSIGSRLAGHIRGRKQVEKFIER